MNRVVADNPTVWRETYQARFDDVEGEWGADACPPSLWRGCLLKESGPKQM
eukprot:CAMPEP_0181217594 /NCGR_PEP_ID=MMETSP1096-20121128/27236_1 /TAXON_ID=156174 ORGANISM="Chrysochromulina ericina, Strain CCMP281" /NCGR_SAMPLE_ID=MMETSP1096 /ASSEMBLY_ACC=CAM_ASM_000453 /LENGTH=50 /DNA_ID=CAMNT_0023309739 /DNA_START=28 /DNA_END=180 /DNA_ORIENTATION=-